MVAKLQITPMNTTIKESIIALNDRKNNKRISADKIIDAKEIQEKLKQTQAKLAGNSGRGGRNLKARNRRDKRREAAENEGNERDDNKFCNL